MPDYVPLDVWTLVGYEMLRRFKPGTLVQVARLYGTAVLRIGDEVPEPYNRERFISVCQPGVGYTDLHADEPVLILRSGHNTCNAPFWALLRNDGTVVHMTLKGPGMPIKVLGRPPKCVDLIHLLYNRSGRNNNPFPDRRFP